LIYLATNLVKPQQYHKPSPTDVVGDKVNCISR